MMAAHLQPNPSEIHMRAEIVYQLSVMSRSSGRISDSERVRTGIFRSQSLHRIRNSIFLVFCTYPMPANQAYRFDFRRACEETCKWGPSSETLLDGHLCLLCDQLCCNGRILRGEGRFHEARRCFEGCLATPGLPSPDDFLSYLTFHTPL